MFRIIFKRFIVVSIPILTENQFAAILSRDGFEYKSTILTFWGPEYPIKVVLTQLKYQNDHGEMLY